MKKLSNLLVAFLLTGTLFTMSACDKDKDEPAIDENTLEVEFGDADVVGYVRHELGLDPTAKVTRGDLKKLTTFNIRGALANVESLKGLEYATELTLIDFGATQVKDLTPLKDLKKVTYLRMNETPVVDLSPVSNYTTLTYFNCNQAGGITDISALAKNTGMQEMILRGNVIGDKMMETISKFEKLHRLNARSTGLKNIAVLGQLMAKGALLITTPGYVENDSELDLRGNEITDFSPIQSYIDAGTAVPVNR